MLNTTTNNRDCLIGKGFRSFCIRIIAGLGVLLPAVSVARAQTGGGSPADRFKRLKAWNTPANRAKLAAYRAALARARRSTLRTPVRRIRISPTILRRTVTPRTPRTLTPARRPVGRISYGGLTYNNHSANTTMTPHTMRVNGTFRITSTSMRFRGSGTRLTVVLEVTNRPRVATGLTRVQLRGVRISGNTLIVRGPSHPYYANQTYRVTVVTWTNGRPDSYASPGLLRLTP